MYFFLSKLLVIFIYPVTWIGIALTVALFSRGENARNRGLIAAFTLLLIFTNPLLLNLFAERWDISDTRLQKEKYSCVIVLGGFVSEGSDGQGRFSTSADRFIQGALLKTRGKADYILITGGNANVMPGKFRESRWAAQRLKELNIDPDCILIEDESRNTLENAKFSSRLLAVEKLEPPYLLVTSAFHMRRAMWIFEKAGVDVHPFASNILAGQERISTKSFLPKAEVLSVWNFYIKEVFGLLAVMIKGV